MSKYCDISVAVINSCITNHPKLCGIRNNLLLCRPILWVRNIQRTWGVVGGGTESGVSLEDPKAGVIWRKGAGIIWSPAHTFAGGWYWLLAWALAGESARTPTCGLSMWSLHFFALWLLVQTSQDCITFNGPSLEVIEHHLLHSHKSPHMGGHTDLSSCWEECQRHSRRVCGMEALIMAILKDIIHSAMQQIVPNTSRNTKFSLGCCGQEQREGMKNSKHDLYLFSSFQF